MKPNVASWNEMTQLAQQALRIHVTLKLFIHLIMALLKIRFHPMAVELMAGLIELRSTARRTRNINRNLMHV